MVHLPFFDMLETNSERKTEIGIVTIVAGRHTMV